MHAVTGVGRQAEPLLYWPHIAFGSSLNKSRGISKINGRLNITLVEALARAILVGMLT